MKINLAHIRVPSTSGGWIDYAGFDAKSSSGGDSDNATLLYQLTAKARAAGLKVDQSALAYSQNGQIRFYDHLRLSFLTVAEGQRAPQGKAGDNAASPLVEQRVGTLRCEMGTEPHPIATL